MTLALFASQAIASPVGVEQARQLGMKYLQSNATKHVANLSLSYTEMTESGTPALYVFSFDEGFVVVAADNVSQPILGYGDEGSFDPNDIPDGMAYFLRHYARQIDYAVTNQLDPDPEIVAQWKQVALDGFVNDQRGTKDVQPLFNLSWNQDCYYNMLCPTSSNWMAPCGHVYAGCVATAMSMVMKYWNWPDHGTGSYSYTPEGFPTQSANFESTYYDWNNMPQSLSNSSSTVQKDAIARLMWHCGISVDMKYAANGSGAHSEDVCDAISNYFRYTDQAELKRREEYTKTEWEDMLMLALDEGFPLYYAGSDPDGGHAFTCLGYRSSDRKFYFNWGWSGSNNNYFAIDALNTSNGTFNDTQRAIFDFIPDYVYNALIPAAEDLAIETANANTKTGLITWTNPTTSMDGTVLTNIEKVVLLRNGVEVFSQANVVPGETMSFEDQVSDYDCYQYRLYYLSNGNVKGRFADKWFQYGPTCSWKVICQTTSFQGWNKGKLQVLNSFGTVVDEITMTSSTPLSQTIKVPVGTVSFRWQAPLSAINSLTIMIKNSSNAQVYSFTGNSNQLNGVVYSGENDCDGCQPPTNLAGEYQWTGEGFGTLLSWDYENDPQSFKVYRSTDGVDYELVATVDKSAREYFDLAEEGEYYYKVTAFRSYCESTPAWAGNDIDYVHVTVTSVMDCEQQSSSIYPNPANTYLTVEAEGLQEVTVYNMMGQVVIQQQCSDDGAVVNTSVLSSGIYTIAIKTQTGSSVKRFAVSR